MIASRGKNRFSQVYCYFSHQSTTGNKKRVCPFVFFLSARISPEQRLIFTKFLCMFMAMARSLSGGYARRYVFPVLWMTTYLYMGHMEAYQYSFSE